MKRIAINRASSRLRGHVREQSQIPRAALDPRSEVECVPDANTPSPSEIVSQAEDKQRLIRCLEMLSSEAQDVIVMRVPRDQLINRYLREDGRTTTVGVGFRIAFSDDVPDSC